MPPKVRITRQDIVEAAVQIIREEGEIALNARNVAARLKCSTQPVFSNFSNMDALRLAAAEAAEQCYCDYVDQEIASGKHPPYKASGMAYIRFAREEKALFRLLYMRDRSQETIPENTDLYARMQAMVREGTGATLEQAQLIHAQMWIFVHGIAVMIATGYMDWDEELVSRMLTDVYQGLKMRLTQGG